MKNLGEVARHSIQVQLEAHKELDAVIIERVRGLKAERKFTATFRDMASLFFSLQDGDTSVLTSLFPDALGASQKPGDSNSGNVSDEDILSKLDKLHRAIEATQQLPSSAYQQRPALAAPRNEDKNGESTEKKPEKLPTPKKKSTSGASFLSAMKALNTDEVPQNVAGY